MRPTADPTLFQWWAEIIIPSFVGLAGVLVAIAAWTTSRAAMRLAREAHLAQEHRELADCRAAFAEAIGSWLWKHQHGGLERPDVLRLATSTGQSAEPIWDWYQQQRTRLSSALEASGQQAILQAHLETGVKHEFDHRVRDWVRSGRFDFDNYEFDLLYGTPEVSY